MVEPTIVEQEALAEVVGDALGLWAGVYDTTWHEDMAIAAALLRAGYRKVDA